MRRDIWYNNGNPGGGFLHGDRSGGQDMLRREYDRINAKWLNAHFRAGAGLAAFICLMEAVVYFALRWMGGMTASGAYT